MLASQAPYKTAQVRILLGHTGECVRASVPVDPTTSTVWQPGPGQGFKLAGVPGDATPIELDFPLPKDTSSLPTGNARDTISVDGQSVS
jgi:2-methylaconitate cis-trans-isomerase PrpF